MNAAVYRVLAPIPEIGAEPGDHFIARPDHPTLPYVLHRQVPRSLAGILLSDSELLELVPYRDGRPVIRVPVPVPGCPQLVQ